MTTSKISFSDVLAFSPRHRKRSKTFYKLQEFDNLIDWNLIVIKLKPIEKNNTKKGGRPSFPLLVKIKMLFLQHVYAMTDEFLEDALLENMSFQEFVGFGVNETIPDFTTHWRFKESLIQNKLYDKIWEEIERQRFVVGKGIKRGEITLIDASIIPSSQTPLSNEKREELKETPSSQRDTDATSTQKNGKNYFGYKVHVGVDYESKLINKFVFTTAKVHDSQAVEKLATGKEKRIIADKAYVNKRYKKLAGAMGFEYEALNRASRSRPLTQKEKEENKGLSKLRCRVEHTFAYIKTKLHYKVARKKNLVRNELTCMCTVLVYNIHRMIFLLKQSKQELTTT